MEVRVKFDSRSLLHSTSVANHKRASEALTRLVDAKHGVHTDRQRAGNMRAEIDVTFSL